MFLGNGAVNSSGGYSTSANSQQNQNGSNPAKMMEVNFANELRSARENSLIGNYTLAIQKFRKVLNLLDRFMSSNQGSVQF